MKRGILESDVLVDSPKVLSVIEILTSSYGHPRNPTKTYDISSKLRQMIERQVRSAKMPRRERETVPCWSRVMRSLSIGLVFSQGFSALRLSARVLLIWTPKHPVESKRSPSRHPKELKKG